MKLERPVHITVPNRSNGCRVIAFDPCVAIVFLKRTCTFNWRWEGKLPPGISQVLCHLEIKFQRLYPCFRWWAFQRSPCQPLPVIPLPRNSRWRPKTESSFILSHALVSQGYLSQLFTTTTLNLTSSTCERGERYVQNWNYFRFFVRHIYFRCDGDTWWYVYYCHWRDQPWQHR